MSVKAIKASKESVLNDELVDSLDYIAMNEDKLRDIVSSTSKTSLRLNNET